MRYVGGIDIGGTKCAVSIGEVQNMTVKTLEKIKFPTPSGPKASIQAMIRALRELTEKHPQCPLEAVGVSCGSPLDSRRGMILAPPNLPDWIDVDIVTPFEKEFGVPAALQNDANACALAEWMWGAGKGSRNMIFLTFGTGMGAGLILDGRLYTGTNDMAGEAGHVRLASDGPVGYHKAGSFEGFCSGGGIARMGAAMIKEHLSRGGSTSILPPGTEPDQVTTAAIGRAAQSGDPLALCIMERAGEKLGMGLAMLVDILNPQVIVIGSIFLRQEAILRPAMERILSREALSYNLNVCRVVPARLGEELGDYAAFSVAMNKLREVQ